MNKIKIFFAIACMMPLSLLPMMQPKSTLTSEQEELFQAIRTGDEHIIDEYIANNGDLNIVDKNKWTPLMTSIIADKDTITLKLLNAGADPNIIDENGKSLINEAIFSNRFRDNTIVIKAFLDKISDINISDAKGETPLHAAARSAKPEIVKLLLDRGANIIARNKDGQTPIAIAKHLKRREPVYELLKNALFERHKKYTEEQAKLLIKQ